MSCRCKNLVFWVWVLTALYAAIKIVLWKSPSVLGDNGWAAAMNHSFAGEPPYYPEENVTIPLYTSVAYSARALVERSGLFRLQHSSETASGTRDQVQ